MNLRSETSNFYEQILAAIISGHPSVVIDAKNAKQLKELLMKQLALLDTFFNTIHCEIASALYSNFVLMSLEAHAKRLHISTKTLERSRKICIAEFIKLLESFENIKTDV